MPIYRAIGNTLVTDAELREKGPALASLGTGVATMEFRAGIAQVAPAAGPAPEPVGPNRPLTVLFHHLYTGVFPRPGFIRDKQDMLVTSALKDFTTVPAQPRALNYMSKGVVARHHATVPHGTEQGTPLICYSPAITQPAYILTVEINFDEFPRPLLDTLKTAFSGLSGIPIFAPAAPYLLGAGVVVKLAGDLANAIFEADSVFKETITLNFDLPHLPVAVADVRVIAAQDFEVERFRVDAQRGLVDRQTGAVYDGDQPYVILSIDGRKQDAFASFTSAAVSSAVLEKFLSVREGGEVAVDALLQAATLLNDLKFRRKADALKKSLGADCVDPDSAKCETAKAALDAALANILSDELRPGA